MGDQGIAAQQYTAEEGELSFSDVIVRLWKGRVLLVVLPLVAACLALIASYATAPHGRNIFAYHISLLGIEHGTYPNGTAFSPNDLKSASVLSDLSEKFDIPVNSLAAAISVNYDNPASAGIALKYQQKLNARNLAPAVIDSINSAYTDELSQLMSSGLRIELDNGLLRLVPSDAMALAFAVPATWNEAYLTRYRVLADTKLTEAAITPIPDSLSGTGKLIVAGEQLNRIENGLRLISEDNRLAGLTTSEGFTADDLKNLFDEFRTTYFDPVMSVGFSSSDMVAVSQKNRLQRLAENIRQQIAGLDQNLARLQGQRPAQSAEMPSFQGANLEQGNLETIISLVKQASYVTYTEKLLDERQNLVRELSTAQSRQDAIILRDGPDAVAISPGLSDVAEAGLQALASKYRDLISAAQKQLTKASGRFYAENGTPSSVFSAPEKSDIAGVNLVLASAIAGLLIALVYAIFAPSIRAALNKRPARATPPIRVVAGGERA